MVSISKKRGGRKENTPFANSYDKARLARRCKNALSQKQEAAKERWSKGFRIEREDKTKHTPLNFATDFGESRRKVDVKLAELREASEMKEVWE